MFHGKIRFQKQNFIVDQVFGREEIVGKYGIGFEMNGRTMIFVINVKEEGTDEKRPVIFETENECKNFIDNFYFPKQYLKCFEITESVFLRDVFPKVGAYKLKKVSIILP